MGPSARAWGPITTSTLRFAWDSAPGGDSLRADERGERGGNGPALREIAVLGAMCRTEVPRPRLFEVDPGICPGFFRFSRYFAVEREEQEAQIPAVWGLRWSLSEMTMRVKLEAAPGFEPGNNGFADRRLSHLAMPPQLLEEQLVIQHGREELQPNHGLVDRRCGASSHRT